MSPTKKPFRAILSHTGKLSCLRPGISTFLPLSIASALSMRLPTNYNSILYVHSIIEAIFSCPAVFPCFICFGFQNFLIGFLRTTP